MYKLKSTAIALVIFNKKILFLLRDDKPNIPNPNVWSLLGGEIEDGETFDQTLERELLEEANITVRNFVYLGKVSSQNGNQHAIYIVKLEEDDLPSIRLGDEGQDLKFFAIDELDTIPFATVMKDYLKIYRNSFKEIIEQNGPVNPKKLGFITK